LSLLLGYNTNGFAHHRLEDALAILADLGYRGVALTLDVHHAPPDSVDVQALAAEVSARGLLPVVETGARFYLAPRRKHQPTLLDPDPDARGLRFDFLVSCLRVAAGVGAPCLSLWSGAAAPGQAEEDCWRRLTTALEALGDEASALGVALAFEPEPGMFVDTMARWDELARRCPHPSLKLTLDVGHLHCLERGRPEEWIREYAAQVVNVHLDDHVRGVHDHRFFGEGEIDFPPVMAALREVARDRDVPANVELSRHSHDAVETARRAWDRLQSYL